MLTRLIDSLEDYYSNPTLIPSLNIANGSTRQQRSCRREACIQILSVFLKFTDLASLRVGFPTADGFVNMTMDYLVAETGLSLRRAERAVRDLKAAQLISVVQPRERKENGEYRGLPAVRCISRDLFGVFDLLPMLKYEQKKAVKRLELKIEKWKRKGKKTSLAVASKFRLLIGGALNNGKKTKKTVLNKAKSQGPPLMAENERQLIDLLIEFKQKNPDWDSDKCREAATKALERADLY